MIATTSALENKVMKAIFGIAQKAKNVNFPKELLVEKEVLKKPQLNAVVNNLKAKGIIHVDVDLFGFHMISMSFDGKKLCKKVSSKSFK
jgi:hypothetical protein